MCRFLLIKSKKPIRPVEMLQSFSLMAKNSKAYDGDWQGDGWGIAWLTKAGWKIYRSLLPVWEESQKFPEFPKTRIIVVHARSASFPEHKNKLEYNQPFINNSTIFVFNGLLKGVKLPFHISGKIGAEKIWHLVKQELKKNSPSVALKKVKNLLIEHTKEIQALNIGLIHQKEIYSLNYFTKYPNYYKLYYYKDSFLKIVCSEKLEYLSK